MLLLPQFASELPTHSWRFAPVIRLGQIVFLQEAYTVQKTCLQLHVRKPLEMLVRNFQFRIKEINLFLEQFPAAQGQLAVKLNNLKLIKLFWRAIPRK